MINVMAVFAVKYRRGLLAPEWRPHLFALMGYVLRKLDGVVPLKIGGVSDHVHVLYSTRGNVADKEIVRRLKTESSKWINENGLTSGQFAWQEGGARFSYSPWDVERLKAYVAGQEEHHRENSFREELMDLYREAHYEPSKYDFPEELI